MNHNKQKKSKNAIQVHHSPLNIGVACDKKMPQRHMGTATQPQSKKKRKTKRNRSAWPPAIILIIGILCIL